jgi:alpha-tubulin suppressor-like RCC1 family protein
VGTWTGVFYVAAGGRHTVGVMSTYMGVLVRCVGDNSEYQCEADWEDDIVQVAAGAFHTVGLKSAGTVDAVGYNDFGQCEGVTSWTSITHIAAGSYHTVGLKSNGTVLAVGWNEYGQCSGVSGWNLG